MYPISIPDQLNEDQLARYLEAMIKKVLDKIHEKRPDLEISDEDKKNLAQNITKLMLEDKNRTELSREALENNPKFLHKLTMALVMTATLEKHKELFKKLDDLFKNKDIKNEKDLLKLLTPQERKELEQIKMELREINGELLDVLKEMHLLKPRPEGIQKEKELEETFDDNTNLIGLVNSHVTGGFAAVISYFIGNLYGSPNQNPNYEDSFSQISEQDKTSDRKVYGDPLGLIEAVEENLEAMGDTLIDEIQSQYRHEEQLRLKH